MLWTKVRRKGKGPPWPGGPGGPLGTLRRWFLRGWGGGQGLPPPLAEAQSVHRGYGPPGRCFRRVPPEPPGHNKACTPPLFTEGLPLALHFRSLFLRGELGLGAGAAPRFAKAPAGILLSFAKPKGFPQREAEGLRPRLIPWKDQRLVVSRSAALSPRPCRSSEVSDPLMFLKK